MVGSPPNQFRRLPRTAAAIAYARREHAGQYRSTGGGPFIEHPLEVAMVLHREGAPDDVIAAGVLHDTLEKTETTEAELSSRFGPRVTAIVSAVTEDPTIRGYARRKSALRDKVAEAGRDALLVFAADKLSKVRELRAAGPSASRPRNRRHKHYRHCLEMLEERLPDSPLVAELRGELDSLLPRRDPTLAGTS